MKPQSLHVIQIEGHVGVDSHQLVESVRQGLDVHLATILTDDALAECSPNLKSPLFQCGQGFLTMAFDKFTGWN